ncbi:MAG TPA: NAD(P)/FAD-dependent oxidoreductase [Gemmatimonadaceae bacterium]|nr:NAD(P)/FAD-dependent oxidoreductase [Gemmatimonadaceae bacterium]
MSASSAAPARAPRAPTRVVVLGGGVGGLTVARHLERLFGVRRDVEVTLVSRDNFFLLPPLLFEACSGVLELRHCAQPIRPCLRHARFVEAAVEAVDVERRMVRAAPSEGEPYELPYDHLVVALGAATNVRLIPGADGARTFKTMADALLLRNHLIERLERADAESDPERRRRQLTVVVIGGGLVGTELTGELTAFADETLRYYPHIRRDELRFHLFEVGERLLPEASPEMAAYATRVLARRGAQVHTRTPVQAVESGGVRLPDGTTVDADTVVLTAGIVPSDAAAAVAVERDRRGRIVTAPTMRSVSHPEVWALGDCALIPGPDGKPYPALAQHAVREAKLLARNVHAAVEGRELRPFVFRTLGTMAALGHTSAVAEVMGMRFTGFPAWWFRRTYYLFQMPRWDRRLRMVLDWTVALLFRPDITKVDLASEREQLRRNRASGGVPSVRAPAEAGLPAAREGASRG